MSLRRTVWDDLRATLDAAEKYCHGLIIEAQDQRDRADAMARVLRRIVDWHEPNENLETSEEYAERIARDGNGPPEWALEVLKRFGLEKAP